jgi:hypothetical protein
LRFRPASVAKFVDAVLAERPSRGDAFGDGSRQLIKLVSGYGYVFTAELTEGNVTNVVVSAAPDIASDRPSQPHQIRRRQPGRWVNPRSAFSISAVAAQRSFRAESPVTRNGSNCNKRQPSGDVRSAATCEERGFEVLFWTVGIWCPWPIVA